MKFNNLANVADSLNITTEYHSAEKTRDICWIVKLSSFLGVGHPTIKDAYSQMRALISLNTHRGTPLLYPPQWAMHGSATGALSCQDYFLGCIPNSSFSNSSDVLAISFQVIGYYNSKGSNSTKYIFRDWLLFMAWNESIIPIIKLRDTSLTTGGEGATCDIVGGGDHKI